MKYHITPKQAREVSEDHFYSMFDEIVRRNDWANYHHRKMTIGKMIDLLGEVTINKSKVDNLWCVLTISDIDFRGKELTDALWEAIKNNMK